MWRDLTEGIAEAFGEFGRSGLEIEQFRFDACAVWYEHEKELRQEAQKNYDWKVKHNEEYRLRRREQAARSRRKRRERLAAEKEKQLDEPIPYRLTWRADFAFVESK